MRKTFTVMTMVMALVLSTMATALAQTGPPSDGNVLDQADITVEVEPLLDPADDPSLIETDFTTVVCDDPYGVDWTLDITNNGNVNANGQPNVGWNNVDGSSGTVSLPSSSVAFDAGQTVTLSRDDFNSFPVQGSTQNISLPLSDGSGGFVLIPINFLDPEDECSEDLSVSVEGDLALDEGDTGNYTVNVKNDGAGFDGDWKLALEVDHDDALDPSDIMLTWNGNNVPFETDGDILFVYGNTEADPLVHGYDENQSFQATFNKGGTFTGTVFLMDASSS